MGCDAEVADACSFALVSYIPGRLARFLDQLRSELKHGCILRSHVTILPPRPIELDIQASVSRIETAIQDTPPFTVELGSVAVFEKSSVVYLTLKRGAEEVRALNARLDTGKLNYCCKFPFHPHITLAQDLTPEQTQSVAAVARERWAAYDGPREFSVEELAFVRSRTPGVWKDLAEVELGHAELSHPELATR